MNIISVLTLYRIWFVCQNIHKRVSSKQLNIKTTTPGNSWPYGKFYTKYVPTYYANMKYQLSGKCKHGGWQLVVSQLILLFLGGLLGVCCSRTKLKVTSFHLKPSCDVYETAEQKRRVWWVKMAFYLGLTWSRIYSSCYFELYTVM